MVPILAGHLENVRAYQRVTILSNPSATLHLPEKNATPNKEKQEAGNRKKILQPRPC